MLAPSERKYRHFIYDGRFAASRASLSRRRTCPVEERRRCFVPLWTATPWLGLRKWWVGSTLVPHHELWSSTSSVESCGTSMGFALAAAMDKESRLRGAPAFCVIINGNIVAHSRRTYRCGREIVFRHMRR